jgi:hypothetical protein
MPPRFNANVDYVTRQENGRWIVINRTRNRRMNKTHATKREALAHIRETKRRVAQVIGYHNRAPAGAFRNRRTQPPPPNRRGVANVGRRVTRGRAGRPRRRQAQTGRRTGGGGPSNAPSTPPRLQRRNTVRTPARRPQAARPRTQGLARGRSRRQKRTPSRLRDFVRD